MALPLTVDGARIGVVSLASRESDLLGDEELRLLQDMTANLSFALQYRQKETTVQYLAYYDPLTGLAKRGLFCERLDKLLQNRVGPEGAPTVVAFDVMNLSNVNDSFGRHVGDLLLQRVAERLKHHVEDDERLGYLGGGTFVMLPGGMEVSAENVTTLLESTVVSRCIQHRGTRDTDLIQVRARALSTRWRGRQHPDPAAEAALKQAKESGEQYLHYQIQMHSDIAERLALEHKLRIALDEKQFVLHYQPQINVATGRIESVEALLRWHDPGEGLMHPALFLPVLETSGMIVPVGEWHFRKPSGIAGAGGRSARAGACRCQRISAAGAAAHFRRSRAGGDRGVRVRRLRGGPGDYRDWPPARYGGASRKLRELRAAGMRIAIDDFGTGYSSLGLLSKLPVDILKIDRSFISGLPGDRASVTLVSSIIGLASAFNLAVVAEGVETLGQLELLRRLKCDYSQGVPAFASGTRRGAGADARQPESADESGFEGGEAFGVGSGLVAGRAMVTWVTAVTVYNHASAFVANRSRIGRRHRVPARGAMSPGKQSACSMLLGQQLGPRALAGCVPAPTRRAI